MKSTKIEIHESFTDPVIDTYESRKVGDLYVELPVYKRGNIEHVVETVRRNAEKYYKDVGDVKAFGVLQSALEKWSDRNYEKRRTAVPLLSQVTGFSEENLEIFGLDSLTEFDVKEMENIKYLVKELLQTKKYDKFHPVENKGYIRAYGQPKIKKHREPEIITHILAGNVVGPPWLSVALGPAGKSGQIIKLPSEDISMLYFLDTLGEIDSEFRKTIAIGYYPGGAKDVEEVLFKYSDIVNAMGSDETIMAVEKELKRANKKAVLFSHPNKIGAAIIWPGYEAPEIGELVAWGSSAMDTNACFSPMNIYIQKDKIEKFAKYVAEHLDKIAKFIPPKKSLPVAISVRKYKLETLRRKLTDEDVKIIEDINGEWTVIVDKSNPYLTPTCQERTIVLKPFNDPKDVIKYLEPLGKHLQTIGLAIEEKELIKYSDKLGQIGVTNIHVPGAEYVLKGWEPHDGIFPSVEIELSDNLRWLAVNFQDPDEEMGKALERKRRYVPR
ncbi:MAG: hypothetical protein J7K72_01155 [Candidatus Aenigmarchaeota archaeon]|nr:hypothetical protein [Candidatus Aenigmarchaeota archaeon]